MIEEERVIFEELSMLKNIEGRFEKENMYVHSFVDFELSKKGHKTELFC
jgi:hypothetical protein